MSFPTSPAFQFMTVRSILPTSISVSVSGRRQARQFAGQRWALTGTLPPMTRTQFAPIHAFCIKQRGQYTSFTLIPPVIGSRQGSATLGTPLTVGTHSAGDRTISTDGWGADGVVLKAGDFLKFASHDKIYMCVSDATTVSNAVTITIEPGLVEEVANNNALTVESVPFTVALDNDLQEYSMAPGTFYSYEIDFVEVL